LRALRAIKSEILLFQTSGTKEALDEAVEIKLLQKMVKQRRDSLSVYEEQGREDLASKERDEIAVISRYLPQQMGEDELRAFLTALIAELGAESMRDMGRVMGEANQRLAGKADGKTIAAIVKSLLG
ncbi:MAG: GatB/YqeY domain-containing protein, partial [Saprospiraceae bacterium]|nr:GatB/YqeY domain-containing protein [Saprospiraceae bacterium]